MLQGGQEKAPYVPKAARSYSGIWGGRNLSSRKLLICLQWLWAGHRMQGKRKEGRTRKKERNDGLEPTALETPFTL